MNTDLAQTLLLKRAQFALASNHLGEARAVCEGVLAQRRDDPAATMLLSQVAWREGEKDEAINLLTAHVKRHAGDAAGRLNLGRFLNEMGRHSEASEQFERLLQKSPGEADALAGLAEGLELRGQADLARARLEPLVQAGRDTPAIARIYARLEIAAKRYDSAVSIARKHVNNPQVDAFYRRQLHYLIGSALERSGDFAGAFDAYQTAHTIQRPTYDIEQERARTEKFIEAFSSRTLASLPRAATDSSKIVFIVGRPRSGTTLVERIIASHPDAHAAGETPTLIKLTQNMSLTLASEHEYPDCIAHMTQESADQLSKAYLDRVTATNPRAQRITDKHLFTWRHLGLVELLLPNARIIDVRRDALDNCLAMYCAPLGDRYPFTYDLRDLGLSHRLYERMMAHWRSALRVPMLTVNYEDLVADQERWTRTMIEFVGLKWDERCLRFFEPTPGSARSRPAAPTLSYEQVRQPMYQSSVGRAQRFSEHLGPLVEALASKPA